MFIIVLMLFSVLSVVGYQVFTEVNTDIQADLDLSNTSKAELDDLHDRFPDTFDGAFALIFGLLFITGIVASLFFESHPAFIVVVIVLMIFLMIAAGLLSNTWDEFSTDTSFSGVATAFPVTDWVLSNFLFIIGVMTVTYGGIIYFKQRV